MKILLTVHQFFPDFRAGTEVLTLSVARELRRRGHEVAVAAGFPAAAGLAARERFDAYAVEGLRVYRFRHAHAPMGGQTAVGEIEHDNHLAARVFARIVRDEAPDVIHAFHLGRWGAGLIDVAVRAGVPMVFTPTDFWSICPTSQLLLPDGRICAGPTAHGGNCVKHLAQATQGALLRGVSRVVPDGVIDMVAAWTARGALPRYPFSADVAATARRRRFVIERLNQLHAIVSPTRMMTRALTAHGVDPALIVACAYGVDVPEAEVAPRPGAQGGGLTLGFIGTLARHKGAHVAIEAVRRLPPDRVRLLIYGDPDDFPDYATRLRGLAGDAPQVSFRGTFAPGDIGKVLAGLDAVVVPSLWVENTPLVAYCALAAGRPPIVSNFPGLAEIVEDGVNGLVFAPGDAPALARTIGRLLAEPGLLADLARRCVRPKTSAEYVDDLLEIYGRRAQAAAPRHGFVARRFAPMEGVLVERQSGLRAPGAGLQEAPTDGRGKGG